MAWPRPGSLFHFHTRIRTGCGCNFKWNSHCNGQRKNCIKRPRKVLIVWARTGSGSGVAVWVWIWAWSRACRAFVLSAGLLALALALPTPRHICPTIMSGNYRIGRNLHYTLRKCCNVTGARVATVCKQCAIFYQQQQQQQKQQQKQRQTRWQ